MFEGEESKKCKGVKKTVVKKSIAHEDYKKVFVYGERTITKDECNKKL